jgi:hypothetical protein
VNQRLLPIDECAWQATLPSATEPALEAMMRRLSRITLAAMLLVGLAGTGAVYAFPQKAAFPHNPGFPSNAFPHNPGFPTAVYGPNLPKPSPRQLPFPLPRGR